MPISTVDRILWRIRESNPDKLVVTNSELRKAIMHEVGLDRRTLAKYRKVLIELGYLRSKGPKHVLMTNKDLL